MRPLQVSRYLRQFPSPCSPNWSLLRQADLNSLQTSLRDDRWQVSRYLRQFPSPCSPSLSLFSQARRNSSHCPPTRTPPGPISIDWEKAEIGITKRAAAAAAPSANFRIPFNIPHPPVAGELPVRIHHAGSGISFRTKSTKVNLRSSAGTAFRKPGRSWSVSHWRFRRLGLRIREQAALRLTPTSGGCEGRTSRLRFVTAGLFFRLKRGAFAPLRRFRLRRETPGQ